MKLKTLTLSALGPFAGTESVDFTRFERSGLFLLRGHTGSGKSTLIDAIVFALFGRQARDEASKERLRSDFAADQDPSKVTLVFEVGGHTYRIQRSPAYQRSDRKHPTKPEASLEELVTNADGTTTVEPIESGVRDVSIEAEQILGLTAEQFLQTVVLPQGDFQQFLTAKSANRTEILSKIFNASLQQSIQGILEQRAKDGAAAVQTRRTQFLSAADGAVAAVASSGVDAGSLQEAVDAAKDPSTGLTHEADVVTVGQQALAQVSRAAEDGRAIQEELRGAKDQAEKALQRGVDLAEVLDQKAALMNRQRELATQAQDMALLHAGIQAAQRAEPLRPVFNRVDNAGQQLEVANARVVSSRQKLAEVGLILDAEKSWENQALDASTFRDQIIGQRSTLAQLLTVEESLPSRQKEVDRLNHAAKQAQQLRDQAKTQADAIPTQVTAAQDQLKDTNSVAQLQPQRAGAVEKLRERLEHALSADQFEKEIKAAERKAQTALKAATEASQNYQQVHQVWLGSASASLAQELEDGQPCPVCGSITHPAPAVSTGDDVPSLEDVNALDQKRMDADGELAETRQTLTALLTKLENERKAAGDDAQTLTSTLEQAQAELKASKQAQDTVDQLTQKLVELGEEKEDLLAQVATLDVEWTRLNQSALNAQKALHADQDRCRQAAGEFNTLAERDQHLGVQADLAQNMTEAVSTLKGAETEQTAAHTALNQALKQAQFDSSEEARSHLWDTETLTDRLAEYQAFEEAVATVAHQLASPRFDVTKPRPDLEKLREENQRANQDFVQASENVGKLQGAVLATREAIEKVRKALSQLQSEREATEPIRRLNAIANVTNRSRENVINTSLETWFLQARLDAVLAAANPRITQVSNGAFELTRTETDESTATKQGLGIAVVDHFTGTTRLPSSLSGGETFYVSLSLALALADVVTSESGGIQMGSMFIDEGFGSLDAEKLDVVMDQLHQLKASGRLVGVISHVEEMAQSIHDQILVTKSADHGSTLTIRA